MKRSKVKKKILTFLIKFDIIIIYERNNIDMRYVQVIGKPNYRPEVENIKGFATEVNSYGNVMFYPDNGIPFYCVCLESKYIKEINDGNKKSG